jgi:thermitase
MRTKLYLVGSLVLFLLAIPGGVSARQVQDCCTVGQTVGQRHRDAAGTPASLGQPTWQPSCQGAAGEKPGQPEPASAPDQLLVRFRPGVAPGKADRVLADHGLSRVRRIQGIDVDLLRLPPGLSVERATEILGRLPEIAYVEPNYVLRILAPPQQDDSLEIVDQWGLDKIEAQSAWDAIAPRNPILLAVVDTGIDRSHPDLASNIWSRPGEIPCNGLDDDGNGYVDDTWGWDFVNADQDPFDDNGHGTAVSSSAAGAGVGVGDKPGVLGVCPWCRLMAVKVMSGEGSGNLADIANGIVYAADNGARVINLSLGTTTSLQTLEDAVNHAWSQGALVVAGAGNNGVRQLFYPAGYANAMAVASTNAEDYHSCFSNYEDGFISVAAPGEAVFCAIPAQGYAKADGTSISTPFVTGLGGLLFSQNPTRTNDEVRALIENSAQDLGPAGVDAFFGHGRIDAFRAVTGDTTPTTPRSGLYSDDPSVSGYAHARKLARDASGALHLAWHGKDGEQYRVLYATSNDDGESWIGPQVVFQSTAETYHPALAVDRSNVYIAFPSMHGSTHYGVFFIAKPLSGGVWPEAPQAVFSGTYDAVRPDLHVDPSNGTLHLAAASLDNAPRIYYNWSADGGQTWNWSPAKEIDVSAIGGNSRYADVHASGPNVYIAGRTVVPQDLGCLFAPRYRLFTIRSTDEGVTWGDSIVHAEHCGLFSGEYGASLAGSEDSLYLSYEHSGAIHFRSSQGGVGWSDPAENLGSGAWPSLARGAGRQAWLMWEREGNLQMSHHTGTAWDPSQELGRGSYPNLPLELGSDPVEWVATDCSGAPFRLAHGPREAFTVSVLSPAHGSTVSQTVTVEIDAPGATSVEWNVDAGPWQAASYNDSTGTYEAAWDTTTSSNSFRHLVNVRATDGAGHTARGYSGVHVDNTSAPPAIAIVEPADGSTVSGMVGIQVDAADDADAGDTLTVEWSVHGGCWQPARYNRSTGRYEAEWDSTVFSDTVYTLNAQAMDRTANTTTISSTFTVDNEAPSTSYRVYLPVVMVHR